MVTEKADHCVARCRGVPTVFFSHCGSRSTHGHHPQQLTTNPEASLWMDPGERRKEEGEHECRMYPRKGQQRERAGKGSRGALNADKIW